ncbi:uncharacterized protein RSE6_09766 [Rhynchosporium secalis]|uniref:SANT domain-containing protein n=1 Tax=Rhynchosporium secalis TaxID=38038 RepID=A0A1E1MIQ2_RHYSE|nr:uncharacterized protein RSE6_09766 [Rhynchosporium secalis]
MARLDCALHRQLLSSPFHNISFATVDGSTISNSRHIRSLLEATYWRQLQQAAATLGHCPAKMNGSYDAGESRRSPRDQSPGRYNDSRDEFRGGGARGGERRRSIPDARMNHNSFASNRELFSANRDTSRDFNSSRDPPRGPKGFPDAPTGPRASSHSEFRGDFGSGYRGDFRGERGRGRGRGWRDDSRDRGRDDREYRDRRDDRGPPPTFRDDRGRDRWGTRESFRGRRASSPQGRGRSPNYGPRDSRDGPPNIEIDRARRGSRDGPLSGGSPGSDSIPPFGRGYGRAPRGGRGRGRGNYYEDGFHRPAGRSRSPEPIYRRTQPSATPPPQVPAFGSATAAASLPTAPNTSVSSTIPTDTAGPIPGVAVPTAPRSYGPTFQAKPAVLPWVNTATNIKNTKSIKPSAPSLANSHLQGTLANEISAITDQPASYQSTTEARRTEDPDDVNKQIAALKSEVKLQPKEDMPSLPRKGLFGKRGPEASVQNPRDIASDSEFEDEEDEEDEVDDAYFEDEISKIEADIKRADEENPQNPPPESPSAFMKPFRHHMIDRMVESRKTIAPETCVTPEFKVEEVQSEAPIEPVSAPIQEPVSQPILAPVAVTVPTPDSGVIPDLPATVSRTSRSRSSTPAILPPKSKASGRSRPSTPPLQSKERQPADAIFNGRATPAQVHLPSARIPLPSVERAESALRDPSPLRSIEHGPSSHQDILAPRPSFTSTAIGTGRKSVPMDVFPESEGEMTEAENEEILEAVRPRMKTPPIASLPNFGNKKWFEDAEFMETLKPNPDVEARIRQKLIDDRDRTKREQEAARKEWGEKYYEYRRFTDFSDDLLAVRSREKFSKARAKAAAEAAAPHQSSVPSAGAKPEPGRRGRWATEHDFERVLRESELEAKETKDTEDRAARAKTASAKEATIPDAAWDREEWRSMQHIDRTHLVPFERSFARLEFGEPIDNFTVEEAELFEKVFLEFPKQWGKIAEALPRRDYKACIQHYYLVKHNLNLKEKLKKQPKKRKARQTKAKNPKPNAMVADPNRDEAEDAQDNDGGERRGRPRRAAAPTFNFEAAASESEVASPAPTPLRKQAATPKGEPGTEVPPPKRKTKAMKEKGTKQAKNSQLLAAAPPIPPTIAAPPPSVSPATPVQNTDWKNRINMPGGNARFSPLTQFDSGPNQPTFAPPYAPIERPNPSMPINFDPLPQQFIHPPPPQPLPAPSVQPPMQEQLNSTPPTIFDGQQDRRATQQTSSYWSVPEQTDFPALLRHFGTDWHGIAKWMTSKTHIMVYTTVFQQWLAVPSDSNKSRRVANIQTQVKNYYQRQVDLGKKEWEMIAKDADEKRERGETTGPLPTPTVIPKRRYDVTPGSHSRAASGMDQNEEFMSPGPSSVMSQVAPPPPPSLSARFPALAQAGPVPQIQSGAATSTILNKHMPHQPIQQAPQQIQQQPRPSRGPVFGNFSNEPPSRPIIANDAAVSQRSVMVAQEAQIERQSALRLEREQREQQRQRELQQSEQEQAMQMERDRHLSHQRELAIQHREQQALRDRQFQMKQENETPNPNQYEPYSIPPAMAPGDQMHARPEPPKPLQQTETRRAAPLQHHMQQYQSRAPPNVRPPLGESAGSAQNLKSTPSPAVPRNPMSAPPANQEMYSAPSHAPPHQQSAQPLQAPPIAARQPEPTRRSNIMSLLNDDEPGPPVKRTSEVSNTPMLNTRTPPPQHPQHQLQHSRYSAHSQQSTPQPHPHMPQQMAAQPQPPPPPPAQSSYSQPMQPQHPLRQHSTSIGQARSYTPTSFDSRPAYVQPQIQQQQQQQHIYTQPRHSLTSQPSGLRREPSIGEMHGMTPSGGYARASGTSSQPHSRLKESPYAAHSAPTPPPPQAQAIRQSMGSPHDLSLEQRDYYQRQQPPQGYFMQAQQQAQQQQAAASPQLGPSYNSPLQQHQQPPANHRQLAFGGQNSPHVPSPPPAQFANHHSLHNSRHNSFDGREGRYTMGSSAPGPSPAPAPIYRPYPGQVLEVRTQRGGERDGQQMMDQRQRERELEVRREAQRRGEPDRREMDGFYQNHK